MKKEAAYPEKLIELIEQKSFDLLNSDEKKYALTYLSIEDYEQLHIAYLETQKFYLGDQKIRVSPNTNSKILDAFKINQPKQVSLLNRSIPIWQVAATFLVLIGITMLLLIQKRALQKELVYLQIHDTVYINVKPQEKILLADSIVPKTAQALNRKSIHAQKRVAQTLLSDEEYVIKKEEIHAISPYLTSGIKTLKPEDLKRESLLNSGKTMKEDSLLRYFSYVGI